MQQRLGELAGNWKGGINKLKRTCSCGNPKGYYAKRCRACHVEFHKGENAFNWQGGIVQSKSTCIQCGGKKSRARYGLCRACSYKKIMQGKNNPRWKGGMENPNVKCDCGNIKAWGARMCSACWEKSRWGENANAWKGGRSFEPYPANFNKKLKSLIKERDAFTCQNCGTHPELLDVHHIDYNKNNLDPENLVCLCKRCHSATQGDRKYWELFYKSYMIQRRLA